MKRFAAVLFAALLLAVLGAYFHAIGPESPVHAQVFPPAVTGATGATGSTGASGATGAAGATGPTGPTLKYILGYVQGSTTLNLSTNFAGNFFPLLGRGASSATENLMSFAAPVSMTIGNLYVHLTTAPGGSGAALIFTLRSNAADKAVTCTITDPAVFCQDITHTYTAAAGELLDWGVTATGTPQSATTGFSIGATGN